MRGAKSLGLPVIVKPARRIERRRLARAPMPDLDAAVELAARYIDRKRAANC